MTEDARADVDVLVATSVHWAATTRLALALAEAGLRVAAVAPSGHALHHMDAIADTFTCIPHSGFVAAVRKAMLALNPATVIPGDDRAVRGLHVLYAEMAASSDPRRQHIAAVIKTALGDPTFFPIVAQKSQFAAFCHSEGLPMPATASIHYRRQLAELLAVMELPQVLKLDGRWSGLGVHIIRSAEALPEAFAELASWTKWRSAFRRAAEELSITPLIERLRHRAPAISVQRYIGGELVNRAVFCREGVVLAGVTVAAVELSAETGPTTVVRIVDHPEVAALTARIVKRLKLSGFIGVDLVLDEAGGRPWILELNPRPTQICHMAFSADSDMVGAMAMALGRPRRDPPDTITSDVVALYPQEYWRDAKSAYFKTAHHDIPWHEPHFIKAYAAPVQADPPSWVSLALRWLTLGALRPRLSPTLAQVNTAGISPDPTPTESAGRTG